MKAMEQQIASLAGLVQHALAIGPAEIDRRTASPFHVNNSAGALITQQLVLQSQIRIRFLWFHAWIIKVILNLPYFNLVLQ